MKFSTSVNFLFSEKPFLQRFAAARQAGIEGVEVQLMEAPAADIANASREAGVEVVLINVDMGDLLQGGPGLSGVPGREQEFAAAVEQAAENADITGSSFVHLGPSKVPDGTNREQCLATYLSNVEASLKLDIFASGRSVPLLEPMNPVDMPDALFSDIDEAASLLRREFGGAVGLQFDIYHVEKSGKNAVQAWHNHYDQIRHVQFSDTPNRQEPGTGEVDFEAIFKTIAESDYTGWVGAEYFPSRPSEQTLGWLSHAK
ncbi:TIM barrel protein [Pseudomaricurvus alkylphenolicus]|nr:TIM barrel protein [Pseudomaricurvus alkylphenolicus]